MPEYSNGSVNLNIQKNYSRVSVALYHVAWRFSLSNHQRNKKHDPSQLREVCRVCVQYQRKLNQLLPAVSPRLNKGRDTTWSDRVNHSTWRLLISIARLFDKSSRNCVFETSCPRISVYFVVDDFIQLYYFRKHAFNSSNILFILFPPSISFFHFLFFPFLFFFSLFLFAMFKGGHVLLIIPQQLESLFSRFNDSPRDPSDMRANFICHSRAQRSMRSWLQRTRFCHGVKNKERWNSKLEEGKGSKTIAFQFTVEQKNTPLRREEFFNLAVENCSFSF